MSKQVTKTVDIRTSTFFPVETNDFKLEKISNYIAYIKPHFQQAVNDVFACDNKLKASQIFCNVPGGIKSILIHAAVGVYKSIANKKAKALWQQSQGYKLKKSQIEILNSNTVPTINTFNVILEHNFISIEKCNKTKYNYVDYWIKISCLIIPNYDDQNNMVFEKHINVHGKEVRKNQKPIYIPIHLNKHMRRLINNGYELKCDVAQLNENGSITLFFQKTIQYKTHGRTVGIDVGMNALFVTDDNQRETTHKGSELQNDLFNNSYKVKVNKQHTRKRTDSDKQNGHFEQVVNNYSKNNADRRTAIKQQIDYAVKQIDFTDVKQVNLEDLSKMKQGHVGYTRNLWFYSYILKRIELYAISQNVFVKYINPYNTSCTCSCCGSTNTIRSPDRSLLSCSSCLIQMDADLNAAINISRR